ncbi:Pentatricopeptide repeat-containing protein, chloroplastic [Glycine soja]
MRHGIFPDIFTYSSLIYGLCHVGQQKEVTSLLNVGEARELFNVMIERGEQHDIINYNILMNGYCLNNKVEVNNLDTITYTILMHEYCLIGKVNEARNLFHGMIERGLVPDVWSYNILIKGYCKFERVGEAMYLLEDIFLMNLVPNIITYNSVVDGLCKSVGILDAWKLVDEMHYCGQPPPDVTSYNNLLESSCRIERVEKTIAFFKHLIFERSFAPNVWSYNILISGCCKNRRLDEAINLFNHMCFKILVPDIVTYNMFLDALFNGQQLDKAIALLVQIVDQGISPNLQTYNLLLNGLHKGGKSKTAQKISLYLSMRGYHPDVQTYIINELCKGIYCLPSINFESVIHLWRNKVRMNLPQPVTRHPCPESHPFSPAPLFFPLSSISTPAREVVVGAALLFTGPASLFMVVPKKSHKNFSLMCMMKRILKYILGSLMLIIGSCQISLFPLSSLFMNLCQSISKKQRGCLCYCIQILMPLFPDLAYNELLSKLFEELGVAVDDVTELIESWHQFSSKFYYGVDRDRERKTLCLLGIGSE